MELFCRAKYPLLSAAASHYSGSAGIFQSLFNGLVQSLHTGFTRAIKLKQERIVFSSAQCGFDFERTSSSGLGDERDAH